MRLILQILLILTIVFTISICAIKPELHKNVIVYDSAYTLVSEQDIKTETKDIPVIEMPTKPVQTAVKIESKTEPAVKTTKTNKVVYEKPKTQNVPSKITTVKQTVAQPQKQTLSKPVTTTVQKPVEKETIKVEQSKIVQEPTTKPVTTTKTLTQQEETIAWNKWRSNLTNQIMQDTKLPAMPNGVVFQFTFNVDKYGKISNVQTGANPSNYTPYAIQYIAPVIRSYQGHSILNFPEGTARISTTVSGKWRIAATEKFSTENDYNDIERVRKY